MRDALPGAASLAAAFETARKTVEQRERAGGLPASSPQAHFGKAIAPPPGPHRSAAPLTRGRP